MRVVVGRVGVGLAAMVLVATSTIAAAQAVSPTASAAAVGGSIVGSPANSPADARGTVTGRITSDTNATSIPGACVTLIDAADRDPQSGSVNGGCADRAGRFSVLVPPGRYVAEFSDPTGRFATEYNGNRVDVSKSPVIVVRRAARTHVSASLAVGGQLSGLAVDAASGSPLTSACPVAHFGRQGGWVRTVTTCSDASGRWSMKGLPAGRFAVGVFPHAGMQPAWAYDAATQQAATLFTLATGASRSIGAVRIASLGSVTGLVTDASGAPVPNAWVNLDGNFPGRAGPGEGPLSAHTDAQGRYTVANVTAGPYRPIVYADDYISFAPEWSGDAETRSGATPVSVPSGGAAILNLQVGPGARVDVDVVAADGGVNSRDITGFITLASGEYIGDFDVYQGSSSGSNTLPEGVFILRLTDNASGRTYWYDRATSPDAAEPVTLSRGETKRITFHLPN